VAAQGELPLLLVGLLVAGVYHGARRDGGLLATGVRHEPQDNADLGQRATASTFYNGGLALGATRSGARVFQRGFPLTTSANDGEAEAADGQSGTDPPTTRGRRGAIPAALLRRTTGRLMQEKRGRLWG
jgi:hypothetical protein